MAVYEDVLYEIDRVWYPNLRFRWGAHDSQKWDMALDLYESKEGQEILQDAASIAQQSRVINGRTVAFPASFQVMFDNGRTEVWRG